MKEHKEHQSAFITTRVDEEVREFIKARMLPLETWNDALRRLLGLHPSMRRRRGGGHSPKTKGDGFRS